MKRPEEGWSSGFSRLFPAKRRNSSVGEKKAMDIAIQVVWWIGLLGALAATLVILREVALVLGVLRDIRHLAEVTRTAARGVTANLKSVPDLAPLGDSAAGLREAVERQAAAAESIAQKLKNWKRGD